MVVSRYAQIVLLLYDNFKLYLPHAIFQIDLMFFNQAMSCIPCYSCNITQRGFAQLNV